MSHQEEAEMAWITKETSYRSPIVQGVLLQVPVYDRYNTEYEYSNILKALSGIHAEKGLVKLPLAWSTLEYIFQELYNIPIVDLRLCQSRPTNSVGILIQKHSDFHQSQSENCQCSENRTCDSCYQPKSSLDCVKESLIGNRK